MDIKLVIFDCDGTLVDSEYANNKATSEVLQSLGHEKFTVEHCIEYFAGCSVDDIIDTLKDLKISNSDEVLQAMHDRGIALAKELGLQPIENATQLLKKIDIPKCIASNGERAMVLSSLDITGLSDYFPQDRIFTRERVSLPKPAPDIYLYAAKIMGEYDSSNCLVIEDSVVGVRAAQAAGMNVIGLVHADGVGPSVIQNLKEQLISAGAFITIKDLLEVLQYL